MKIFLFSFILFLISGCSEDPGIKIHYSPIQTKTKEDILYINGFKITPLRDIDVSAKVLNIKKYNSKIAPLDFALGWEKMSDDDNLKDISITQYKRWYYWQTKKKLKNISIQEIQKQSSNWHIIPLNKEIENELKNIDKNDLIQLKGNLVSVYKLDKLIFNSSLTRNDTGARACEVILVKEVISLEN